MAKNKDKLKGSIVSSTVIADLLCLESKRRVEQLVKEGILPRITRGKYDPIDCVQSYIKYIKDINGDSDKSLMDEKKALIKVQRETAQIDLAEKKGQLLDKKDVESEAFKNGRMVRDSLKNIPARLSTILAVEKKPVKIKKLLDEEIRKVIEKISI